MKFVAQNAGIWMAGSVFWAGPLAQGTPRGFWIILLLDAILSLPASLLFLALQPSTRGTSIALGLAGGLLPGIGLIVWGYSIGIAASCCGASAGSVLFLLGVQAAVTGLPAGLCMGMLWSDPREARR